MIKDLISNELKQNIESDICIIGGGAAGITLALDLMDSNLNVVLLESGGMDYEVETQELYKGNTTGRDYYYLNIDRLRQFGGTTNHWGGWCTPLNSIDFKKRDWIENSGWPIKRDDLDKYYTHAQKVCDLAKYNYDASYWLEPEFPLIDFNNDMFQDMLYQYSKPLRFGYAYKAQLNKAKNIEVYLHSNVVNLKCNEVCNTIKQVKVKTLSGKSLNVKAKTYVLACGGMENARLLLASNSQSKKGIGNDHDMVGRYFMDHLEGIVGHMILGNKEEGRWLNSYSKRVLKDKDARVRPGKKLSDSYQYKNKLLNAAFHFDSVMDQNSGYLAAKRLALGLLKQKQYFQKGTPVSDAFNVISDIDEVALWIHHRINGTNYEFPRTLEPAEIRVALETEPNPNSRILLSNKKDKLGMQEIDLKWKIGTLEKKTLLKTSSQIAIELSRTTGLRVKLKDWLIDTSDVVDLQPGHHHMGTTRMSDNPKDGVVDKDCKVHGVDNLYVAGSSVFPTCGYANPTLTLVALASRLASHLKKKS